MANQGFLDYAGEKLGARIEAFGEAHPGKVDVIENLLDGAQHQISEFEIRHPYTRQNGLTTVLAGVAIGAEALNIRLANRPNSIGNSLSRASFKAVAIGAGYLTVKVFDGTLLE